VRFLKLSGILKKDTPGGKSSLRYEIPHYSSNLLSELEIKLKMKTLKQGAEAGTLKRRGRGCLVWLVGLVVLFVGLGLAGAIKESAATAADSRTYPPPGRLVDVGGYKLHIDCTGTGSPTVVIDAGMNEFSTEWAWVQPGVAKSTMVCTYDRAGTGWSDPGPLPRNAAQIAKELHTLLHEANIPGPYVVVGQSLGGIHARVFAGMYPAEVAGVVLIDSMSLRQFTQSSSTTTLTDSLSHPFTILPTLTRIGLVRLVAKPLGAVPHLPPEAENAYLSRIVRPSYLQAISDYSQGMPASGRQAAAVKSFGDIPLIVLTARLKSTIPDWQAWQTELLQLSSNSQQLFAENSGHNIELEQPEAAVAAIVKMVEIVRQTIQK
jgi:pimeloyl-ACP methyl ester carboxylesterase